MSGLPRAPGERRGNPEVALPGVSGAAMAVRQCRFWRGAKNHPARNRVALRDREPAVVQSQAAAASLNPLPRPRPRVSCASGGPSTREAEFSGIGEDKASWPKHSRPGRGGRNTRAATLHLPAGFGISAAESPDQARQGCARETRLAVHQTLHYGMEAAARDDGADCDCLAVGGGTARGRVGGRAGA